METNLKDFKGENIYVGIDSHLKSWNVTIMCEEMELRNFTQEPDSSKLSSFLKKHYPGADYRCVYEAGFAGFGIQRSLSAEGVNCMVINPADVPTSDKEKRQKSDRVDSRKLARELKKGDLKAIYIPDLEQQQDRSLLRANDRLTRDITRVKNRIKSFLMFSSLLLTYKSAIRMMDGNKAIIKVARKLLNRIRFVLKNNKPYQILIDLKK